MIAFNVYLNGECIDTVFHNSHADGGAPTKAEDVKQGLIDHDGYDPGITVRRERKTLKDPKDVA